MSFKGFTQRFRKHTLLLLTGIPAVAILATPLSSPAQQLPLADQVWSGEVIRPNGQPVVPLFDGWFPNEDGSSSLCFGYFNLNTEQSFDIPLGELNNLSDSRFDAMLPTHFEPLPPRYRRKFCVFTIQVPADFGRDETIVWSLTSSGQTLTVPGHTKPAYIMDEPASDGRGDLAPLIKLTPDHEGVRGRVGLHAAQTLTTRVDETLQIRAWIEHPDRQVWTGWSKHSGPGDVLFDFAESQVNIAQSPAGVSAVFKQPGNYVIRLQSIDNIAAFEFYCCHSNAYFNVSVSE